MLEQLLYSTTPHNLNTSHLRTIIAALCIINVSCIQQLLKYDSFCLSKYNLEILREELIKGDLLFVF